LSRVHDNIRQNFGAVLRAILAGYNSARMPAKYILVLVTIIGSWQEINEKFGQVRARWAEFGGILG
jgi:hypothetical protein